MHIQAMTVDTIGGRFRPRRVEIPEIRHDEILVEVRGVGLCHTDLGARDGIYGLPYPVVLGHEGSGVVAQVGETVADIAPGDHVTISFNSCGACASCRDGHPAYCAQFTEYNYIGTRADGSRPLVADTEIASNFFGQSSFATHAVANVRNVVKVDEELDVELLGPLGCGIQTGAGAVLRSFDAQPGTSLLVLGGGSVGLAAAMAGRIAECAHVIVVEPHASRRDLAIELGATEAIDPGAGDLTKQIRDIVADGVDYVVDTTGIPSVLQAAIQSAGVRAKVGLVGVPKDFSVELPLNMVGTMQTGLTLMGIVEGDSDPQTFIPELIDLHRQGRFPFDKLIATYPLSKINDAVDAQLSGEAVKIVLIPES